MEITDYNPEGARRLIEAIFFGDSEEDEEEEPANLDEATLNRIHLLFLRKLAAKEPDHPWVQGITLHD